MLYSIRRYIKLYLGKIDKIIELLIKNEKEIQTYSGALDYEIKKFLCKN